MAYSKAVLCAGAAWWALAAAPVMAQTVEGSGVAVPASAITAALLTLVLRALL